MKNRSSFPTKMKKSMLYNDDNLAPLIYCWKTYPPPIELVFLMGNQFSYRKN